MSERNVDYAYDVDKARRVRRFRVTLRGRTLRLLLLQWHPCQPSPNKPIQVYKWYVGYSKALCQIIAGAL